MFALATTEAATQSEALRATQFRSEAILNRIFDYGRNEDWNTHDKKLGPLCRSRSRTNLGGWKAAGLGKGCYIEAMWVRCATIVC